MRSPTDETRVIAAVERLASPSPYLNALALLFVGSVCWMNADSKGPLYSDAGITLAGMPVAAEMAAGS